MLRTVSRRALTLLMDALVLIAVAVTAGIVSRFFGAVDSTLVGGRLGDIASALTVPLGLPSWQTPYAGAFHADTGVTVALVLCAEWLLSVFRRRSM